MRTAGARSSSLHAWSRRRSSVQSVSSSSAVAGTSRIDFTPEQTTQHIQGEVSKWAKVIKEANVKAD